MAWNGVRHFSSYIIGIYTDVPDKIEGFERYSRHVNWMYENIDGWTFEEFKIQERDRLRWERDAAEVAATMLKRLKKAQQIGN